MIAEEFGIEKVAVLATWIEEFEPGRHAFNMIALDTPSTGHA